MMNKMRRVYELAESPIFAAVLIALIFIGHIYWAGDFGLTWDIPHQIKIGEMELGIDRHYTFNSYPYGIMTDLVPVVLASALPSKLLPYSYSYFGILAAFIGSIFFYLLLTRYTNNLIAFSATLLLLFIPRFIGHMHANIKDLGSASFFMASMYFLFRYIEAYRWRYAVWAIIFFIFSVNIKLTIYQMFPVFLVAIALSFLIKNKGSRISQKDIFSSMAFLFLLGTIPIVIWIILWPHQLFSLFSSLENLGVLINAYSNTDSWYAMRQFLGTTPLILIATTMWGIMISVYDYQKHKRWFGIFFSFFFVYTIFKYPLFRLPIIDDIRYFVDIYFAISFLSVFGLYFVFKKYALIPILLIIAFCIRQSYVIHPYEITYMNILSDNRDVDFWASSYKEVFEYINATAPKNSTVSARLAPELSYFLIRDDLKKNLNSQNLENSDFVVILNRPSYFRLFRVEDFYDRKTPIKIIRAKNGEELSFIYNLRKKK